MTSMTNTDLNTDLNTSESRGIEEAVAPTSASFQHKMQHVPAQAEDREDRERRLKSPSQRNVALNLTQFTLPNTPSVPANSGELPFPTTADFFLSADEHKHAIDGSDVDNGNYSFFAAEDSNARFETPRQDYATKRGHISSMYKRHRESVRSANKAGGPEWCTQPRASRQRWHTLDTVESIRIVPEKRQLKLPACTPSSIPIPKSQNIYAEDRMLRAQCKDSLAPSLSMANVELLQNDRRRDISRDFEASVPEESYNREAAPEEHDSIGEEDESIFEFEL